MIKFVAFTYNQRMLVTVYGIDPFAADFCPYQNIFEPATANRGALRCFQKLVNGNEYTVPKLTDLEVIVEDKTAKVFSAKGKTVVDGVEYQIKFNAEGIQAINPDGIDVNLEVVTPTAEDTVSEPGKVQEVEPAPIPVDEPVDEPAEDINQAAEVEVIQQADEETTEETTTETVNEETTAADEDATIETEIVETEEPAEVAEIVEETESFDTEIDAFMSELEKPTPSAIVEDFMNPPVSAEKPSGFKVGMSRGSVPMHVMIGTRTTTTPGISLHDRVQPVPAQRPTIQRSRYTVTGRPVTTDIQQRAMESISMHTPEPSVKIEPPSVQPDEELLKQAKEAEENLRKRWVESGSHRTMHVETADPIVEESKPAVDKEEAKKEFKKNLDPNILRFIDDIPLALCGNIIEFTTNEVDKHLLSLRNEAYCIDNRWHKSGKWYCIDIVNTKERFFFNSKLDVSYAVPIQLLREWATFLV